MKPAFFASAFLVFATCAAAQAPCESCRPLDERQIGDYIEPEIPSPRAAPQHDPRGREVPLPLPGEPAIRHRPGAGVFVGEAGQGNNVFINAGRTKATLGIKRDF